MKNLKNLGIILNKEEQKQIHGGKGDGILCPAGGFCADTFLSVAGIPPDGSFCAIFTNGICTGTVQSGQCCFE